MDSIYVHSITAPEGKLQAFSISDIGIVCHERSNPAEVFFTIPWSAFPPGSSPRGLVTGRVSGGRATTKVLPPNVELHKTIRGTVLRLDCSEALDFWVEVSF